MRRELKHFRVDGAYGWNQDWFPDLFMRMGGCAAVTACDAMVYFALRRGRADLIPFPPAEDVARTDYLVLSRRMKPFLHPRMRGIDKLSIYEDGVADYLKTIGASGLKAVGFSGEQPYAAAEQAVVEQIDGGYPIPFLTLRHQDPVLDPYEWHWYLLMGYDRTPEKTLVQTVTYGHTLWLDFRRLWDTGFPEKGGFIRFSLD